MEDNTPVKRGRGRPPLTEAQKRENKELRARGELAPGRMPHELKNMETGDNTRYIEHTLAVKSLPKIDHKDPVQVEQRIYDYLAICAQNDMKPTVNGFCNSIGVTRQTIFNWKSGTFREGTHQAVILEYYALLEELWEDYMLNGKINPVSGIFLAKNLFTGYSDKQEFVLTPNQMGEAVSPEVLAAKYEELPED